METESHLSSVNSDRNQVKIISSKDISVISQSSNELSTKSNKKKTHINSRIRTFINQNLLDIKIVITNIIIICGYSFTLLSPCDSKLSSCKYEFSFEFFDVFGIILFSIAFLFAYLTIFLFKQQRLFHFIYMLPIMLAFFTHNTGIYNDQHGSYSTFAFLFIYSMFLIFFIIMHIQLKLIRAKRYFTLFVFNVSFIIIMVLYNTNMIINLSCSQWDKGLNNTSIDDTSKEYPCLMDRPDKCYMNSLEGLFDFTKMLNHHCEAEHVRENEVDTFYSNVKKNKRKTTHFGFPITSSPHFFPNKYKINVEFQKIIYDRLVDMTAYNKGLLSSNIQRPEIEIKLNRTTKRGNITINLQKNETLSEERKRISQHTHSLYDNVLIIYLDAVSRQNFFRKLDKTASFLDGFTRYAPNPDTKNFTVFQFFKYHSIKPRTEHNIKPMFYGVSYKEHNGTNIVKYYKEQGYVTGHTGTTCSREIFDVDLNKEPYKYLDYDFYDHENIAMFCDKNYLDKSTSWTKGPSSQLKRCLYGKNAYEYAMEYTKQFWRAYKDNKKFFRIHINDGQEGSNEVISYLNDPLYNFIREFYDKGWLNNTLLMIVSDHGNPLAGPVSAINPGDFKIEKTLGTLFLMIPNERRLYDNGVYEDIKENSQTFVTPFDVHDTLVHIAYGDEYKEDKYSQQGQSLLTYIDYTERYCENPKINYKISSFDCHCFYKNKTVMQLIKYFVDKYILFII